MTTATPCTRRPAAGGEAPSLPPEVATSLPFARALARVPLGSGECVDLHVVEHGDPDGRPVLFLHGNRSWSITWRHVMRRRCDLRLLAVDLPGFGLSRPLPARRPTLAGYGEAIARLLEQLRIEQCVFVAHEAGGLVAAAAAAHSPLVFGGGVLVASAVLPALDVPPTLHRFGGWLRLRDFAFAATGRPRLALAALQAQRTDFAANCAALYAWPLARAQRRAMLQLAALAAEPSARLATGEWLRNFSGPLALVWGHRDPLMQPEDFAAQERELPYARIWRTEAGHFVQEEEPGQVAEAIAWVAERVGQAPAPDLPANFLPGIGSGDFAEVGRDQVRRLAGLGGLRPSDRILDVGCGLGRTARALREFLGPAGRYDGIDVVTDVVRWCQQNLTRVDARLRFHEAPVRNDLYNPRGAIAAREYRLPFEDESFDFVIAESLFTHLTGEDARHYLVEIARVLRCGGTLWASAFLLDAATPREMAAGRTDRHFTVPSGGGWVEDAEEPLRAVAFQLDWFLTALHATGLQPADPPLWGSWRGSGSASSYQDTVVARRRAAPPKLFAIE